MDEGLEEMWTESVQGISAINPATENWKIQTLPLARIKKIMKSEEFILQELEKEKQQKAAEEGQQGAEVDKPILKFMISGEAPVLMSKACELLIKDLSFRAWRHTERNRRRTLQRQDLHAAVGESEVFDFLIDIVPRVSTPKTSVPSPADAAAAAAAAAAMAPPMPPGIPMGAIPTALPTLAQPMASSAPVGQHMPAIIDGSMMQQMQHHQQPGSAPQQAMVTHQYPDINQQQYPNYMTMPATTGTDMSQTSAPMAVPTVPPPSHSAPQWTVPNTSNAPQAG